MESEVRWYGKTWSVTDGEVGDYGELGLRWIIGITAATTPTSSCGVNWGKVAVYIVYCQCPSQGLLMGELGECHPWSWPAWRVVLGRERPRTYRRTWIVPWSDDAARYHFTTNSGWNLEFSPAILHRPETLRGNHGRDLHRFERGPQKNSQPARVSTSKQPVGVLFGAEDVMPYQLSLSYSSCHVTGIVTHDNLESNTAVRPGGMDASWVWSCRVNWREIFIW